MTALRVFLPLAICLLLGYQTFAHNNPPCQKSEKNNAFNTFKARHILAKLPTNLDHNVWEEHINKENNCKRTTQSFLGSEELERVKAVCTKEGGKTYKGNLCISDQLFNFVTVRIKEGTCTINSVNQENKHLILACDKLENQCLPVHFEKNDGNEEPKKNPKNCEAP